MSTIYFEGQILTVGKIIAVGSNYRDHVQEMKGSFEPPGEFPVIFFKPPSAIMHSGGTILKPQYSSQMDYEAECVVVIGKTGKHISRESARDYILGYTIGLDMTLRDIQKRCKSRGEPWAIAKGFDTSAVVGSIVPTAKIENPQDMEIRLWVNGQLKQSASTSWMLMDVSELIATVSRFFTLHRGDLIFTGTPAGVGSVVSGDRIRAELGNYVFVEAVVADEH